MCSWIIWGFIDHILSFNVVVREEGACAAAALQGATWGPMVLRSD